MSPCSTNPKVRLRVDASDPATEIFVTLGQSQPVANRRGSLLADLSPGLYKVRVRAGFEEQERLVALQAGDSEKSISFPALEFSTPVPLSNSAGLLKEHEQAAMVESETLHASFGSGSWIFIFARDPSFSGTATANPVRGLSLRRVSGEVLVDLAVQSKLDTAHGWAACNVALSPGSYTLVMELESSERLTQVLVATLGWQTHVFLARRSDSNGRADYDSVQRAGIVLTALRPGKLIPGFRSDDPVLRQVELARLGMMSSSEALLDYVCEEVRAAKSLDPMLGIYGAHLLVRNASPDLAVLGKLVGDLRQQGLSDHPDVEALSLLLPSMPGSSFTTPPMLRRSWELILRGTIKRPELVPLDSLASRVAGSLWGDEPWLLWMDSVKDKHADLTSFVDLQASLEAQLRQLHAGTDPQPAASTRSVSATDRPNTPAISDESMGVLVQSLKLPRARVEKLLSDRSQSTQAADSSPESRTKAGRQRRARKRTRRQVDVAIITIREDENRAVLDRVSNQTVLARRNRTYSVGEIDGQNHCTVAVVRTPEQGPGVAQDTARDAIEDLDPTWIMVVGIAGAVPDNEFTLGDVVVATRLHDFSVGALLQDAPSGFANQGGPMAKEVQDLVALLPALDKDLKGWETPERIHASRPTVDLAAGNFYGDDDWRSWTRSSLEGHFSGPHARTFPIVTTRAIASSGFLVKDTDTIKQWRDSSRDVMAIEMELSGVYAASRRRKKQYPVVAIRGISDVVGFKRSPDWTNYACQTAGAFCLALLENLPRNFLCR